MMIFIMFCSFGLVVEKHYAGNLERQQRRGD